MRQIEFKADSPQPLHHGMMKDECEPPSQPVGLNVDKQEDRQVEPEQGGTAQAQGV